MRVAADEARGVRGGFFFFCLMCDVCGGRCIQEEGQLFVSTVLFASYVFIYTHTPYTYTT